VSTQDGAAAAGVTRLLAHHDFKGSARSFRLSSPRPDFNRADQLFFDQIVEAAVNDDGLRKAAVVKREDKFELVFIPVDGKFQGADRPSRRHQQGQCGKEARSRQWCSCAASDGRQA
jgi:hypothetical protein